MTAFPKIEIMQKEVLPFSLRNRKSPLNCHVKLKETFRLSNSWFVISNCVSRFLFYDQDLAGDVVQNLHEFFRSMYKKVSSSLFGQQHLLMSNG